MSIAISILLAAATAAPAPPLLALGGGVMLLPLRTTPLEPLTVELLDSDQGTRTLDATVIFLRQEILTHREWSVPVVQTSASTQSADGASPYIAIELPDDGAGNLRIADATIPLEWEPLPTGMPPLRQASQRHPPASGSWSHLPLGDPTQAWRCELAAALGLADIDPDRFGNSADALVANATLGPWRRALHRIHAADAGVARQVSELLTGIVNSPFGPIAGWLTRGDALAELLVMTNEAERPDDPLAERFLRWCERQTPLHVWIDRAHNNPVDVSLANASAQALLAEIAWARGGEIPLATQVASRALMQVGQPAEEGLERTPLLVEVGVNHLLLPVNREPDIVEPPGLLVGPFHPPRTLEDVALGQPPTPRREDLQTHAHLRRLMGRWELMLECRTPGASSTLLDGEAVTIQMVCGTGTYEVIVSPNGLESTKGPTAATPIAHIRVTDDAWLCRLRLPEDWVHCDQPRFAFARHHHLTSNIDAWPTPCVPWNMTLDPSSFDWSNWDQLPPEPLKRIAP